MIRVRLDASDLDDIREMLPVHGAIFVAGHIGCARQTVGKRARQMGLAWDKRRNKRPPELAARDVPGVAKVCTGCDQLKNLDQFRPRRRDGYQGTASHCKACVKIKRRKRWLETGT